MKRALKPLVAALASTLLASAAQADINIGVSLPLTGPASGLGIPMKNYFALFPQTIAGEKVNLIILDDATDPTKGVVNAKRFVTEDKGNLILGSAATPMAIGVAMADVAMESGTVQLAFSPAQSPPGKDACDTRIVLVMILPVALKKAKPGTKGFRAAIKAALEGMGRTVLAHGVKNWSPTDHWGYPNETGVMLKVVYSDWKLA